MPRRAGPLGRALIFLIASCVAQVSLAQPIRLMTGGAAKLIYLPVVLADRLGYFRREGLDVRVLSVPAGIDTSTELVAGAIEGAVGFYDHTIGLQSRGMDVQSVIVLGQSAGLIELGTNGMRNMADAKGRRLGVTGFGSSTYFLTRYLATRAGLAPDAYTIVPLANEAAFDKALSSGDVDAVMTEEPTATRLLSRGAAKPLVDLRSVADTQRQLGGPYVGACLYMRRDWIDAHPVETGRLAHALLDALRFIGTHSEADIEAAMPASLKGNDPAIYRQALSVMKPAFSSTGRMPAGAPSTVLATLADIDTEVSARHVDLTRTWTDRFVADAH
ncbi:MULTISPECIES: ABC transporter substrate-binding protein [unclassified Caballeronia]|uniref:ABC transporter substrate-binding protein n=1 Tax=unclassified Caballeronia TaxID=2646786 RepID=UPI0028543075|nr:MULTISPECIES: ABC transporter substrate-binding protein [unclassified Caballeronia]MDR5774472.1 ABC transporter substrate-binding protein [Caballeronia sp. LZ002]MDR5849908.1 ABC transporter substrate-binding protein [Caballeronia sp. LZ003]